MSLTERLIGWSVLAFLGVCAFGALVMLARVLL